jgi:hypothetical protein
MADRWLGGIDYSDALGFLEKLKLVICVYSFPPLQDRLRPAGTPRRVFDIYRDRPKFSRRVTAQQSASLLALAGCCTGCMAPRIQKTR